MKKTPVLALATRLFVSAAFVAGQPVVAEPTPNVAVRTSSEAFAALQDFVRTQRVVSLNFAPAPSAGQPHDAPQSLADNYAVLSEFVQVADASGTVPLPAEPQAVPPDDAIHAGLRGATSGDMAQGAAPNDAIHAGLHPKVSTARDDYSVLKDFVADGSGAGQGAAPNDAIHAGLQGATAPNDAIHARLHGAAKTTDTWARQAAPDDAIHSGLSGSGKSASEDYSALRAFAAGESDAKPMVLAAAALEAPKTKKPVAVDTGPAIYVGSQACVRCHRDQFANFEQTLHGQIFLHHPRDAQEKEGCESCHGPGSKHVRTKAPEDIISFAKDSPIPVADRNAICLNCHERADRTYWDGSVHQTRDLACTTCHQVMEKVSVKFLLAKATEPEVCFQCHKDVRAKMVNSSHMPILNGSVTCSSCHNPHGSATEGLLREASVNETCYKCHADKRGPFLWEHEPVRDNCLNCHNPHGSVNEYMLIMQRPRLCQSCHMGPGHGNPGNPMTVQAVNRSCQNCHTFVHGSNSPAGELFQR